MFISTLGMLVADRTPEIQVLHWNLETEEHVIIAVRMHFKLPTGQNTTGERFSPGF